MRVQYLILTHVVFKGKSSFQDISKAVIFFLLDFHLTSSARGSQHALINLKDDTARAAANK